MAFDATSALALTRDLIRRRTINPPGEERVCAEPLARLLAAGGFEVSTHSYAEGRTSLVATLSGSGEGAPIGFTGHLDTVPLGSAPWEVDPLGAEIAGERLYGRGSSDMKSGVAAMTMAALAIARAPHRRAGLVLVFTAGEETGCDGARYLASLDGVLPKVGALVVGEPTSNAPLIGHRGALWLRAGFTGVTAHGSMPEEGDNAIYKAARGVLRLADHAFGAERHHHLGGASLNVGSLRGGLNINSVPDRAEMEIDIRTVPGQTNEAICAEIAGLLGEDVEITRIVDVEPVASNPQNQWISDVFDLWEKASGRRADPRGATYFTDASVLVPAMGPMPTLILGPGEPSLAHKTNEYCLVPRIEESVSLYEEIGRRWVSA